MESNPREFVYAHTTGQTSGNFNGRLVEQAAQYLTPEEKRVVKKGMRQANLNYLHEVLMGAILKSGDKP
jgi:hypothetical protein